LWRRKSDKVRAMQAAGEKAPVIDTVGVGIVLKPSFQSETFLALVVHSLVPGSSADLSTMIQVRAAARKCPSAMRPSGWNPCLLGA
jgi:hypothetical protein